jgi:HPr kinase/phosphorylase
MTPARCTALHGTALVTGETGLLILGASGAGKSALALALIGAARAGGHFARLVSDDRVVLAANAGRIIMRGHPAVAGFIEARGAGILPVPHLSAARLDAVIAIEAAPARLPAPDDLVFELEGIALPCLPLKGDADLNGKVHLVREWLMLHRL